MDSCLRRWGAPHASGRPPSARVRSHSRSAGARSADAARAGAVPWRSSRPSDADRGRRRVCDLAGEAAAFVADAGSLGDCSPRTTSRPSLELLDVADQPLEPLALLGLARFVESVAAVAGSVRARRRPATRGCARLSLAPPRRSPTKTSAIDRAIEPSGDVSDQRESRRCATSATRCAGSARSCGRRSKALTRGRDTAKYLQDQIVTDRNGRYVRRRARRTSRRDSGHRPRQLGERREPVPRAARDRRAQQRRRRARRAREARRSTASCSRSTDAFRRARRRARCDASTPPPSSTSCTRKAALAAARRRHRARRSPTTAASSSAARAIRC